MTQVVEDSVNLNCCKDGSLQNPMQLSKNQQKLP